MIIEFDNQLDPTYDSLEDIYLLIGETALELTGTKGNYEVDVSLVDENTIQEINRDYRGVDRVTDVISFAFNDDKSETGKIVGDEYPRLLGEIFVCIPRALEQAKEIGNTPERELRFLFAHGMLHLLGYDHIKKEDEEIMFPLQERVLEEVAKKEAKA